MRTWFLLSSILLAGAATAGPTTPGELAAAIAGSKVVLLGEVHDNHHLHALRAEALRLRLEAGWRPVLLFEHFDRERQADIDRARAEKPDDVDHLIARAGGSNWPWPELKPLLQLALQYRLPILAANVSRADAGRVIRAGLEKVLEPGVLAGAGLPAVRPVLPAQVDQGQREAIQRGHCGEAPAEMLPGMAAAQVARDLYMAALIRRHAAQGVLLLAGNGHVRRDIGVPYWLPQLPGMLVVGITEQPAPSGWFDRNLQVPPVERPDPCLALRSANPAKR